jgi:hypothetical protein
MGAITRPAKKGRTRKKPAGEISLENLAELMGLPAMVFRARHVCPHGKPFCTHERCEVKLPSGDSWPLLMAGSFLIEIHVPICLVYSPQSSRAVKQEIMRLGKYC